MNVVLIGGSSINWTPPVLTDLVIGPELGAGILYVRQTIQRLPDQGMTFRAPKTHRSARPVALSGRLLGLTQDFG